ncbi:helix-turn-helix domain-containing protein [Sphingobium cloacae]|uniref:helix-turn-helix domain-containing protein n=1 Tax=Sphingobium cloacae TaxID=120107 RepID=UPI00082DB956|nr:helix-turn-helix domain-containing protein [Sphingobium cloacae]
MAQVRIALAAGRSTVFLRLFDFLVERSQDDRSPKEVEIALAVFGDDGIRENAADSTVRVYVHRLRKRLDEFYAGKTGPRLMIPKGEYRIVLGSGPGAVVYGRRLPWRPPLPSRRTAVIAGVVALVIAAALVLWAVSPRKEADPRARALGATAFWRSIASGPPPLIVAGSSFMVAETRDQKQISRIILDPEISSREDLGQHLKTHPEDFYRLYDLDLNFSPSGTAIAAWDIQDILSGLGMASAGALPIAISSKLDPNMLATNSIVYVGRLSSLGPIAAPLFRASRLRPGGAYNELVDTSSGRHYLADPEPGKTRAPRKDYGYIGRFSGPSGNVIVVIGGIGDTGVESMAALVSDPAQLRAIDARIAGAARFEALFEVSAIDDVIVDRRLVLARALN